MIPKRWHAVEEGSIYRSGRLSSALVKKTLEKHGIRVIVALSGEKPDDRDQKAEIQAARELGIELLRFPLRGNGTGDIPVYAHAVAAVAIARQEGKPVLVHCAAGAQRTGSVLACYQLLIEKREPSTVIRDLIRYGHDPEKNPALLAYINENLSEVAMILHEEGVIDEVPNRLPVLHVWTRGFWNSLF